MAVHECSPFSTENLDRRTMLNQVFLLTAAALFVAAHHDTIGPYGAIVKLTGQDVQGNVTFTQLENGKIRVQGSLTGLPAGHYGFHVHEKGDITGGCLSTGAHFNPEHKDHGSPSDENRHVGDLGNVEFNQSGASNIDFEDSLISLVGPHGILGRAVVLHEKVDDLGRTRHPDSKKTGNAGGRVACGVIGILSPVDGWRTIDALSSAAISTCSVISTILIPSFLYIPSLH